MLRRMVFFERGADAVAGEASSSLFVQGGFLILFGILILVVPQLLAVLVASALFAAGAFLLYLGYQTRKLRKDFWRRRSSVYWDSF